MKTHTAAALIALLPVVSLAQVPVDADGNLIGSYQSAAEVMPIGEDSIPKLSDSELENLVGPVALYPDDLLAIVLPASAYPLQLAAAARFLEELESDPTLQPDPEWDDSIVALINYPEVVELLNEDLDWAWRLGEAVVAQQSDVITAVESFRDRAFAAGNLRTDEYQTVARNDGVINVTPASEDVIYVPYYEPESVVYYQPRPAYYYHPRPYPVYNYPYSSDRYFDRGQFWGVSTAFSVGWFTDSLHVHHHSYRSHPYYGRRYANDSLYRRPSINVYNNTYVYNSDMSVNWNNDGDRWTAREERREHNRNEGYVTAKNRSPHRKNTRDKEREPITFRTRDTQIRTLETLRQQQPTYATRRQVPAARARTVARDTSNREDAIARARTETARVESQRVRRTGVVRPEPVKRDRSTPVARTNVQSVERRQVETRTRVQSAQPQAQPSQPRVQQQARPSTPTHTPPTRSQSTSRSRSAPTRSTQRTRTKDRQH